MPESDRFEVGRLDGRLTALEARNDRMEERFDGLNAKLDEMSHGLNAKLADISATLAERRGERSAGSTALHWIVTAIAAGSGWFYNFTHMTWGSH